MSVEKGTFLISEVGVFEISISEEDFSPMDPGMMEVGSGKGMTLLMMEGLVFLPRQYGPRHLLPLEHSSQLEDLDSILLMFGRKLSPLRCLHNVVIS